MNNCNNCHWFLSAGKAGPGRGHCFYNPPVVQFMPVEVPIAGGGALALPGGKEMSGAVNVRVEMRPMCAVPMVREVDLCHNWTPKGYAISVAGNMKIDAPGAAKTH